MASTAPASNGVKKTRGKAKRGSTAKKNAGGTMRKKSHGSKTAFIRKHPEMSPIELSEAAKNAGLKITPEYVSTVRSNDKSRGTTSTTKRKVGRPKAATPEQQFRDLLIHFGVDRAAELLAQFRTKLEALTLS